MLYVVNPDDRISPLNSNKKKKKHTHMQCTCAMRAQRFNMLGILRVSIISQCRVLGVRKKCPKIIFMTLSLSFTFLPRAPLASQPTHPFQSCAPLRSLHRCSFIYVIMVRNVCVFKKFCFYFMAVWCAEYYTHKKLNVCGPPILARTPCMYNSV